MGWDGANLPHHITSVNYHSYLQSSIVYVIIEVETYLTLSSLCYCFYRCRYNNCSVAMILLLCNSEKNLVRVISNVTTVVAIIIILVTQF